MASRTSALMALIVGLLGCTSWWLADRADAIPTPVDEPLVAAVAAAAGIAPDPALTDERGAPAVDFAVMQATTPAEVREVLRLTVAATAHAAPALRAAALQATDPLVAGAAGRALGRLRRFSADRELLALTADPRLRVRQDAVIACGLDGDVAAVPHLERVLAAADPRMRPLALDALGKIGGPTARALVERVAEDPAAGDTDRAFAQAALTAMTTGR
ncbi:MAG: HEAT repeat domain-containing protein [Planctomycetes bacterium]|nr:HEAT repeat domain-containing protein [Planctomycetota bacterium]